MPKVWSFQPMKVNSVIYILIAGLLGLVLRWMSIESRGLWQDEITTFSVVSSGLGVILRDWDIHPPLYYLYLWVLDPLSIGLGERSYRLWNLSSWLALSAFAVFAQSRVRKESAHAILFIMFASACLPLAVYFGAELRMYGLLGNLFLATVFTGLIIVERRDRPDGLWLWIVFGITCSLSVLTQYGALVLVASLILSLLASSTLVKLHYSKAKLVGLALGLVAPQAPFIVATVNDLLNSGPTYQLRQNDVYALVSFGAVPLIFTGLVLVLPICVTWMVKRSGSSKDHTKTVRTTPALFLVLIPITTLLLWSVAELLRPGATLGPGLLSLLTLVFAVGLSGAFWFAGTFIRSLSLLVVVAVSLPLNSELLLRPNLLGSHRISLVDVAREGLQAVDKENLSILYVDNNHTFDYVDNNHTFDFFQSSVKSEMPFLLINQFNDPSLNRQNLSDWISTPETIPHDCELIVSRATWVVRDLLLPSDRMTISLDPSGYSAIRCKVER